MEKTKTEKKRFVFPGSKIHTTPFLSYTIEHMSLKIKPDLVNKILIDCEQRMRIRAFKDLSEIMLDISDLKVTKVHSQSINISKFRCVDNKQVIIEFSDQFRAGSTVDIEISYSAGFTIIDGKEKFDSPKTGFHFITKGDQGKRSPSYQAWTQGEATESRSWFPSIDTPQVKFTLDIEISAPQGYMVISNGILQSKVRKDEFIVWRYVEKKPLPSYLVSVVIGTFSKYESKYRDVSLNYYWPEEIKEEDAMLTFSETSQMLKFFEEYFDTNYPFQKYSQTAVDNFEFGGMENTTCTTLTRRVLHDKQASKDYRNDIFLVVHELAHQWFGDMVTCKDWPHIWLNEGFATYCESLYWENSRGKDEFHYNLIEATDIYFEESNKLYNRPIVTNVYKHVDDLFDAHSYEKSGFILHMIRNYIGEHNFRKSLKVYLEKYQNRSAESLDLLKVLEEVSGREMTSFFDQWIYRKGHPKLKIEYTLEHNNLTKNVKNTQKLKIKIQQKNYDERVEDLSNYYQFQLEFKISIVDKSGQKSHWVHLMNVDNKDSESFVNIDIDSNIEYISIDPEFKILKEIRSVKVVNETRDFQLRKLLYNQMKYGETIIERITALRYLKKLKSIDGIRVISDAIVQDKFYGVAVEAANAIGSFYDKNDYEKSDNSYQSLLSILNNKLTFDALRSETKKAIIRNIGKFERIESISFLEELIYESNVESNFVRSSAATALGKSSKEMEKVENKILIISLLKNLVEGTNTFQSVLATGALEGLKELTMERDGKIHIEIAHFILENTLDSKDYFVRAKATLNLAKFLVNKNDISSAETSDMNQAVFNRLKELLRDDRRKIKINACSALADEDGRFHTIPDKRTYETIEVLINVAKNDLDGFVRRKAEHSANIVREWIKDWASKPLLINCDSTSIS
ncbi:M1 family aminopeptidase [Candidatus Nitrosocosmicus sp. T]